MLLMIWHLMLILWHLSLLTSWYLRLMPALHAADTLAPFSAHILAPPTPYTPATRAAHALHLLSNSHGGRRAKVILGPTGLTSATSLGGVRARRPSRWLQRQKRVSGQVCVCVRVQRMKRILQPALLC